jgi:hypothetical protein
MLISYDLTIIGKFYLADDNSENGKFYHLSSRLWASLPENISNRIYFHDGVERVLFMAD